eukprot:scaffold7312_cov64-Phaeocystis_antarctica.AAC.1
MQAYAKPGAGPGDGAPGSEEPALIEMNNQRTKWGHVMPVRTHSDHRALSPCGRGEAACTEKPRVVPSESSPFSSGLRVPHLPRQTLTCSASPTRSASLASAQRACIACALHACSEVLAEHLALAPFSLPSRTGSLLS